MVPMIIRVLAEGEVCEVPITPETTCADVIDCVRDPGDETCTLLQTWGHGYERVLKDSDKPYEILQEWGAQKDPCKLVLKYTVLPSPAVNGRGSETRNGMKEPGLIGDSLPEGGCELTLGELEEMALRQQAQIESQRQQLAAREQRLRFLKQHEARHQQVAAEHERLRHLRDRVHLQELKLRKLRALRGQLHHNKLSNAALTSDLDSIRALFNEKEKELSLAVAKVEELTTQLEELRRGGKGGRGGGGARSEQQMQSAAVQQSAAALELEKLRRELMYRNKLNEQQTARLSQQREALTQRQEEVASIDKRIAELQDRLHRKRLLNQQLASQINAAAAANNHQQHLRSSLSASTIQQHQQQQHSLYQQSAMRGNIAAVEPYHHVPAPLPTPLGKPGDHVVQPRPPPYPTSQTRSEYNGHDEFVEAKMLAARKNSGNFLDEKKPEKCDEALPEFGASKSDPKYQTLPYNTKFGVNYVSKQPRSSAEGGENNGEAVTENKGQQQLMSIAHSTPVPPGGVSRGLATQVKSPPSTTSDSPSPSFAHPPASLAASRVYGSTTTSSLLSRGQPVGGASSTTSSTSSLATNSSTGSATGHQKPISSVAPTSVQAHLSQSSSTKLLQPSGGSAPQELPSQIYQTSSTKIQPVQPQTLSSTPQGILRDQKSDDSGQESGTGSLKPALPPKPAAPQAGAKSTPPPPPRQMVHWSSDPPLDDQDAKRPPPPLTLRPSVDISADAVDSAINVLRGAVSISARGAMTSAQEYLVTKSSNSTYQPEPTDSSVPPPPPTTEPPADDTPTRRTEPSSAPIKPRPLGIIKQQQQQLQQQQTYTNDPRSRVGSGGLSQDSGNDVVNSSTSNNGNNVRLGTQDVSPTYSTSESSDQSPASNVQFSTSRRIEMPPAFLFPETEAPPADLLPAGTGSSEPETYGDSGGSPTTANRPTDENCNVEDNNRLSSDKVENEIETRNNLNNNNNNSNNNNNNINSLSGSKETGSSDVIGPASVRRAKKGNLKGGGGGGGGSKQSRRVSFDPLALLLDASLEGELELVVRTAGQVRDPSAANDEGITALHNAICAGHLDIVRFLVRFGCDVNAQDSDGWTPLHCAASCNNLAMVKFLVEHGACIFATTLSDQETAAEKCEEDEEGFDGCSEYLYSVQEKLGILNNGAVFAVFSYEAHQADELSFGEGDRLIVLRKGDEWEREWWWTRLGDREGYVPRNLLGLYPRVHNKPTE